MTRPAAIVLVAWIVSAMACSAKDRASDGGAGSGGGGSSAGGAAGATTGGTAGTGGAAGTGGSPTGGAGGSGQTGGSAGTGGTLYAVGDKAQAPDYSLTLTTVTECVVSPYFEPQPGNIKLGVAVAIQSTAGKEVPANPYYGELKDDGGGSYTSTFGGCEPELTAVTLQPGQTASGWITFELPETATGLTFTYSPIIVGSSAQPVTFDLGL